MFLFSLMVMNSTISKEIENFIPKRKYWETQYLCYSFILEVYNRSLLEYQITFSKEFVKLSRLTTTKRSLK